MSQQTSQLRKVEEGVDEVSVTLKVANKQVRAYAKRVATDKMFLISIALIVLGVLFIIIWYIVKGTNPLTPPADVFN